jgi:hypothetical protein
VEFPDGARIAVADGRSTKLLNCLRRVRRTRSQLSRREELPTVVFNWVREAIPPAWRYPEDPTGRIEYFAVRTRLAILDTPWRMHSPISIWCTQVGAIEVHFKREKPIAWEGPFFFEKNIWITSRIG